MNLNSRHLEVKFKVMEQIFCMSSCADKYYINVADYFFRRLNLLVFFYFFKGESEFLQFYTSLHLRRKYCSFVLQVVTGYFVDHNSAYKHKYDKFIRYNSLVRSKPVVLMF